MSPGKLGEIVKFTPNEYFRVNWDVIKTVEDLVAVIKATPLATVEFEKKAVSEEVREKYMVKVEDEPKKFQ